jgi:hypothetical protein
VNPVRRFVVADRSMEPTLVEGQGLVATRLGRARPGQIRCFEHPHRPGFWLVKRVAHVNPDATMTVVSDSPKGTDSRTLGPVRVAGSYRVVLAVPRRLTGAPGKPYDAPVTIDELADGKYISLATFKRDGTRVATPVWVTREGDHLYAITDADSGKAKRLRNSPRAEVAPCDMRGNVTGGTVPATAVLLDDAGTKRVMDLVTRKYGLMARAFGLAGAAQKLIGRGSDRVGIEVTIAE